MVEDLGRKVEEGTKKQQPAAQQLPSAVTGNTEELSQEEMGQLFNDNYDDDDDDDENSFSISRVQAESGFAKDEDGTLILKGRTAGAADARPSSAASSSVSELLAASERRYPKEAEPVKLQAAFQPGASPRHYTSRFLAYNSVGLVKGFTSESESSLDVEFHDVAVHHAFHLANPEGYQLAAITGRLLLLAREGDEETAAKLCVNYFASSDINKEWSLELALGETIHAVAGKKKMHLHIPPSSLCLILTELGTGNRGKILLSIFQRISFKKKKAGFFC